MRACESQGQVTRKRERKRVCEEKEIIRKEMKIEMFNAKEEEGERERERE